MSNFQLTVIVMNRIMLTSIILLKQTFNANDVDIMVFELSVLFDPPPPPAPQFFFGGGGIDDMVQDLSYNDHGHTMTIHAREKTFRSPNDGNMVLFERNLQT